MLQIVTCKLGTFEEAMYTEKIGKLVDRERTKNKTNVQERENKNHKALERDGRPGGSRLDFQVHVRLGLAFFPWTQNLL